MFTHLFDSTTLRRWRLEYPDKGDTLGNTIFGKVFHDEASFTRMAESCEVVMPLFSLCAPIRNPAR